MKDLIESAKLNLEGIIEQDERGNNYVKLEIAGYWELFGHIQALFDGIELLTDENNTSDHQKKACTAANHLARIGSKLVPWGLNDLADDFLKDLKEQQQNCTNEQ